MIPAIVEVAVYVESYRLQRRKFPLQELTMNRTTVRVFTVALFALLFAVAMPTAFGQTCSTAKAAGTYGFKLAGSLLPPTGPVLGAGVGRVTADAEGNLAGGEARNVGGGFATETILGTWTVNSDCTGTATFNVYQSGTLVRQTSFSLVFVDGMRGGYAVEQTLVLPDGTNLPAVITVDLTKISAGKDQ
jgi:hypothetical protein